MNFNNRDTYTIMPTDYGMLKLKRLYNSANESNIFIIYSVFDLVEVMRNEV